MRAREFTLLEVVSDPEVAKTQQKLVGLGYDLGPYGPKGDGVDGIVGPYTQAAMDAYEKGISPKDAPKPKQADVIKYNQEVGFVDKGNGSMPVNGRITTRHGDPTSLGPHPGIDIAAPAGTPIRSPISGTVSAVGSDSTRGNWLQVDGGGVAHRFLHLSQINVNKGDKVNSGDTVGLVGSTGYSTGPHLHWEKYVAGRLADPTVA